MTPPDVSFEDARNQDASALVSLSREVWQEALHGSLFDVGLSFPALMAPASYAQARNGGFWLARFKQERILGFLSCHASQDGEQNPTLEISHFAVRSEARGRGIGTKLLACAIHKAAVENTRFITVWADIRLHDLIDFFRAREFAFGDNVRQSLRRLTPQQAGEQQVIAVSEVQGVLNVPELLDRF